VLAVAQVGVVWHRAAIELPGVPDAACPVVSPITESTADYFYGCGLHQAWRLDPLSLWEGAGHGPATQTVAQIALALAVATAGLWLHGRARRARVSLEPTSPAEPAAPKVRARPTQG